MFTMKKWLYEKKKFVDYFGLYHILIYSLGYVILCKPFAELNFKLPFLSFPIFIGEILLFSCLLLFLFGYSKDIKQMNWVGYVFVLYFCFVIVKALWGYSLWGPFALRNAALFYYPSFAFLGYFFFRADFFTHTKKVVFCCILLALLIFNKYYVYWALTNYVLCFILIFKFPSKILRFFLFFLLFFLTSYRPFFDVARMMLLGNTVAILFYFIVFTCILKVPLKYKLSFLLLFFVFVLVGSSRFIDKNAVISMMDVGGMVQNYKAKIELRDERIRQNPVYYEEQRNEKKKLKIYNPTRFENYGIFENEEKTLNKYRKRLQNIAYSEIGMGQSIYDQKELEKRKLMEAQGSKVASETIEDKSSLEARIKLADKRIESLVVRERKGKKKMKYRSLREANNNSIFRIIIWMGMLEELINEKPLLGFHFGKPIRSDTLEILGWAKSAWGRDGWIGAHNSFFHMIYRAGIIGLGMVLAFFIVFINMTKEFIKMRSLSGILLCGILLNWAVAINFLLLLELPYTSIPIWSLYGMTLAYLKHKRDIQNSNNIAG